MAGIGLNLCRRLLRDRDWAVFSLDALLQDRAIGEPADTGPGPAEAAEAAEIARRVKDAVRALPPGPAAGGRGVLPVRPQPGRSGRPSGHPGRRGQGPAAQSARFAARQPP
jgi:hypothetical protein